MPERGPLPVRQVGATIELDGSQSYSPVAGRSIAGWHWSFGDGTEAVTTTPTVAHTYRPGTEHTVSLYVEDSAGALSAPVTQSVALPPGSLLTASVSGLGSISGGDLSCPPRCSAIQPPGTEVSLVAIPAPGHLFDG